MYAEDHLNVSISYCCSDEYDYHTLRADLTIPFDFQVHVTGNMSVCLCCFPCPPRGKFEVKVESKIGSREMILVHSKKCGDGLVDTSEKKRKIYDAIKRGLEMSEPRK